MPSHVIRTAILEANKRIRPNVPGYTRGPGPVFKVSPIRKDKRGEYQIINMVDKLNIRVPPLHTWTNGYVLKPDWPPPPGPVLTIEFDPILPG
jgi:hypothetical protein